LYESWASHSERHSKYGPKGKFEDEGVHLALVSVHSLLGNSSKALHHAKQALAGPTTSSEDIKGIKHFRKLRAPKVRAFLATLE
jgi:hypothetical protein